MNGNPMLNKKKIIFLSQLLFNPEKYTFAGVKQDRIIFFYFFRVTWVTFCLPGY